MIMRLGASIGRRSCAQLHDHGVPEHTKRPSARVVIGLRVVVGCGQRLGAEIQVVEIENGATRVGILAAMPSRRPIPDELAAGPFRLADAEAVGVSRSQLRGSRYSRPFRGVHVAGTVSTLGERCVAALAVLPASAVFSDETAAALHGLPLPFQSSPQGRLHVTTTSGIAVRRTGMAGHVRQLRAAEVTMVGVLYVTTAARTFVDLAARFSRVALLALGDAMLRAGSATTAELVACIEKQGGRRGVRRARELLELLDPRSESPMESLLRLLFIDAGLPRPEVNVNLYDIAGAFLARADLLFRAARVVVEYEGDHHRTDRRQFAHDVRRGSRLAAAGYLVLRFTADDVLRRPQYVIATVRAALAARV